MKVTPWFILVPNKSIDLFQIAQENVGNSLQKTINEKKNSILNSNSTQITPKKSIPSSSKKSLPTLHENKVQTQATRTSTLQKHQHQSTNYFFMCKCGILCLFFLLSLWKFGGYSCALTSSHSTLAYLQSYYSAVLLL